MKLQKLIYYSQAWSLVWDDEPLFNNKIEAWANGPVVRDLYEKHRGKYQVSAGDFAPFASNGLTENQKDTIDQVLNVYGLNFRHSHILPRLLNRDTNRE